MNTFLSHLPIAHRGLHGSAPENSMSAFEEAIKAGYAIETDVRLTKDGALILFHDDDLLRMTGVKKKVIDCTLSEIQALRLNGTREKIPLFSEFLALLDGRVPLLLEIKNVPEIDGKTFMNQLSRALEGYKGEYAIQSFQPYYTREFRKLRKNVLCGILATAGSSKKDFGNSPFWRLKSFVVKHMSLNSWVRPDFISFCFSDYPTRETEKFKGIKLGWTVRSKEDERYARMYADNIIFEGYLPEK